MDSLTHVSGTNRRHRPGTQQRREALLRAAVEVAAESGYASVTHRAVTERAGLPIATVGYFFNSIDELLEEALRSHAESTTSQLIELAEKLEDMHLEPEAIAAVFASLIGTARPEMLALFEAFLAAARSPAFTEPVSAAINAARRVAAAAAYAAGATDPDGLAAAFAALSHGFALHKLANPDAVTQPMVQAAFRALFVGFSSPILDTSHVHG